MKIPLLLVALFRENHAQGTDRRLSRKKNRPSIALMISDLLS